MVALAARKTVNRRAKLERVLIENLMAATPCALAGGDGLTVDVLLGQYAALADKGLVPGRRQLVQRHPRLAR